MSTMSRPGVAMTQRERIVAALSTRISGGDLRTGDRLGSETEIAAEFGVSRGTVRAALAELQRLDLIATRPGLGSFVTFDGRPLDPTTGWARALTDAGAEVTAEILGITLLPAHDRSETDPFATRSARILPTELAGRDVVAVSRRRLLGGRPISYEHAVVPATGPLRDLPTTGLVDDSLTATLRAAGLVAHHGRQEARVVPTPDDVAAHLEHAPGTAVLRTRRLSYAADGGVVEHVESYLDPDHFSLQLTFGDFPA